MVVVQTLGYKPLKFETEYFFDNLGGITAGVESEGVTYGTGDVWYRAKFTLLFWLSPLHVG